MSPYSRPDLAKEYPLILSTGRRSVLYFHAEHRNIKALRELEPDPTIEIHPATAKPLGIQDGDWVWVESPNGKCKRKARYFTGLDPAWSRPPTAGGYGEEGRRLVRRLGGRDQPAHPGRNPGPVRVRGGQYKSILCKIYKADEGVEGIYQKETL